MRKAALIGGNIGGSCHIGGYELKAAIPSLRVKPKLLLE